ncbi:MULTISPECIES: lytic transglycosylase domain-containing protein [Sphingomonas]|uniref:Transglycosylase SLT domain-containing protein n=1 Tax=Sphingomonas trueperi TaxID=53317 RepID=A0A7X5XZ68_9SPHN|nr:hypothetical protein [Sphingomonas trueperi]
MRRLACHLTAAAFAITSPPGMAAAQEVPPARTAVAPVASSIVEAARRFGLPEAWIWAVIRVESRGNAAAVSPAGAMGLMQVMPATWAAMRTRYGLGADPFDAHDNIVAGAAFLRLMLDRYGNPAAMLAAYNAGPGRYDDWVARRRPLPAETVAYVAQLGDVTGGSGVAGAAPDPLAWTHAPLFIRVGADGPAAAPARADDTSGTLPLRIAAAEDARPDTLFAVRFGVASPQPDRTRTPDRREADTP